MTKKKTSVVALVRGEDRRQNILHALRLLDKEIAVGRKPLVKPNFVSTKVQLAASHADAARAVVDFLREKTSRPIIIGEGAAASDTFKGYENFNFLKLRGKYQDVKFTDLNRDDFEIVTLYDQKLNPQPFRIARTTLESDFRVSLSIPKTHDATCITLSLKNMVVGSLIRDVGPNIVNLAGRIADKGMRLVPSRIKPLFSFQGLSRLGITKIGGSDKVKLHQGYLNIHLFLYQLARIIPPHLCVLDGFEAMEGNGPVSGDRVDWRIAIAGTDFLATDTVAAVLMGFDPEDIGYLYFCKSDKLGEGNIDKIKVIGTPLKECLRPFRPHQSYKKQLDWKKNSKKVFKMLRVLL
ncbi:MAG: DUF362 domain-containing protein [Deltaproteobacteria bacterium]|nr:DUF362 domain-containing protein [Deltaproteobacteria bacterium]